jgi:hypothetical protein
MVELEEENWREKRALMLYIHYDIISTVYRNLNILTVACIMKYVFLFFSLFFLLVFQILLFVLKKEGYCNT